MSGKLTVTEHTDYPVYILHTERDNGRSACADLPFVQVPFDRRNNVPLEMCTGCLIMTQGPLVEEN